MGAQAKSPNYSFCFQMLTMQTDTNYLFEPFNESLGENDLLKSQAEDTEYKRAIFLSISKPTLGMTVDHVVTKNIFDPKNETMTKTLTQLSRLMTWKDDVWFKLKAFKCVKRI